LGTEKWVGGAEAKQVDMGKTKISEVAGVGKVHTSRSGPRFKFCCVRRD
jgi:hypothetical protein